MPLHRAPSDRRFCDFDDTGRMGQHRKAPPLLSTEVRRFRAVPASFKGRRGMALAARRKPPSNSGRSGGVRHMRIVTIWTAIIVTAVIAVITALYGESAGGNPAPLSAGVRRMPGSYIGVYTRGVPHTYAGVSAFTATTGVSPGVVVYYSGWREPFQVRFAKAAAKHDAMPLVQIDPTGVSLAAIASGRYDVYLRSYASAVKAFGRRVILSFGHEMNGSWYSWGYRHASPAVFVAAWRHIVTVFRAAGARNVIWLWTVNIIQCRCHILSPSAYWPGSSYVTWVGIDGYYYEPSWTFAPLFGPTIKAVRALTLDPILITETAAPAAIQPAKIADLFAGVRAYGLLGFVWFDVNKRQDWRISSPEASAAFRRGARAYRRSA
jgi:mannan endo-1,4-beta-mannosidase